MLSLQMVAMPLEKALQHQVQFKQTAAALPAQAVQLFRAPPHLSHARFSPKIGQQH